MLSIKVTAIAITLLTVCALGTSTISGYQGCCRGYMKGKLRLSIIEGYSVQDISEMCNINAIIFHTTRGKACTNPALRWVMDRVNSIRSKAQKAHQNAAELDA
ncbi:C-C motif chemokine 20a.3 [Cololabis saira]|uniref:C-C motif chemokine 20a.3 n=1 Tax=Cololabis saira TaxID=129043 RepID=UPI002AD1E64A|nr:C-C motif chemokine 20a.3 [Cololabis saira]